MSRFLLCLLVVCAGSLASQVHAQVPLQGMTWSPPPDLREAQRDLIRMDSMGVRAIRTPVIEEERLLQLADTLGLALYLDADADYWTTETFRDSTARLRRHVRQVLDLAGRHDAITSVGLGRFPDTSSPAVCDTLAALSETVRAAGLSTHLSVHTAGALGCSGEIDLVLLDARFRNPREVLAAHRDTSAARESTFGIGALGAYVLPGREGGYRTPHTAAWQARRLENALASFYTAAEATAADTAAAPAVLFLHRWRDGGSAERGWGLYSADGTARPVAEVVRGFYTGEQTVFAFEGGQARPSEEPWRIVIAWLLIFVLAVGYAFSPLLRRMMPRYFAASGFYRESIREGRGTMTGMAAILAVVIAGAFGVTLTGIPVALQESAAAEAAATWWGSIDWIIGEPGTPGLSIALVAGIWLLGAALWGAWISFLSRPWYSLTPAQGLLLVLWPRWFYVPLMMAMLTLHETGAGFLPLAVTAGLFVAWMLWAYARTSYDVAKVTHMPGSRVALAVLLSPPIVLTLLAFFIALQYASNLRYLYVLLRHGA